MERVREVLAIHPRAGVHRISELLAIDSRSPLKLDPHYILKLKRKIENERSRRFDTVKVEKYISQLEDEIEQVVVRAWKILLRSYDEKAKIAAAKVIIYAKLKLLDAKLNSGIFEKHLGTLKIEGRLTEERKTLIIQAFQHFGIVKDEVLPMTQGKENINGNTKSIATHS